MVQALPHSVMPAKAGIQEQATGYVILDSRFRGNDGVEG
jgi:hypothetical protein